MTSEIPMTRSDNHSRQTERRLWIDGDNILSR